MVDMKPCPTCNGPKCCHCEFTPVALGADWGYLNGPNWSDYCCHVSAMRYCASCSQNWWRVGLEGDWDVDGCGHEDCPECVTAEAKERRR